MQNQERDWKSLPTDLLGDILSRLFFFKDRVRFRFVCKEWRSATDALLTSSSSSTSSLVMESLELAEPSQWLMYGKQFGTNYKFFNPMYRGICEFDFPELSGATLRFSKDGWLLMSRGSKSVFFFKPFTKEMIPLPDLPRHSEYSFSGICFTSPPTSPGCMVFGTFREDAWESTGTRFLSRIFVYNIIIGEERWYLNWFEQEEQDEKFLPSFCNPVFHNGLFYVLGRGGSLGVSDPKTEEISWQFLDKLQPILDPELVRESYLMECDGQLLSLFVKNYSHVVYVYRLDESMMIWKRVKDLGDNMMFVSHCSSFVAEKKIHGMENKIYFPLVRKIRRKKNKTGGGMENKKDDLGFIDGDGVFYSLETDKFHTFLTNFSSNSLLSTSERMHCCWIELNCQSEEGTSTDCRTECPDQVNEFDSS